MNIIPIQKSPRRQVLQTLNHLSSLLTIVIEQNHAQVEIVDQ